MGFSALVAQGAGAATQGIGAFYAAQGQRTALKGQARIAEINARIAEGQARDAMLQGERAQQMLRQRGAEIKGTQRVALGANMVDLSSETAVALQTSTDVLAERDVLTAELNALKNAWGYRMEATGQRGQAAMSRAQAKGINPLLAGTTSLLSGATETGLSYLSLRESGALSADKAPKWVPKRWTTG